MEHGEEETVEEEDKDEDVGIEEDDKVVDPKVIGEELEKSTTGKEVGPEKVSNEDDEKEEEEVEGFSN